MVINGGYGYDQKNTNIQILTYGKNANFDAKIKSWQINYASRILNSNNINSPDDGVLYFEEPNNIKYCHVYSPSKLRQKLYSKFLDENGNLTVRSDYENSISNIKYYKNQKWWVFFFLFFFILLFSNKQKETNVIKYALTERNVLSVTKHPFIVRLNYAF